MKVSPVYKKLIVDLFLRARTECICVGEKCTSSGACVISELTSAERADALMELDFASCTERDAQELLLACVMRYTAATPNRKLSTATSNQGSGK